MASQTTGNISDLSWTVSTHVDESSLKASINRMGQALRDVDKEMTTGRQQERTQLTLQAQKEREARDAIDATMALSEAEERAFAATQQHVAELDAAYEASEAQRLAATIAQVEAVENDLQRASVRVMTTEQRINHEYRQRLIAIDDIEGATAQHTAELRRQAGVVRDTTMEVERQRGNLAGVGGAGRIGTRIQEFGRGFEDFTVGFSMAKTNIEGVAMGLRGSANNAAQLAASFNPVVGAAVAIGASLATVIVPMMMKSLFNSKELEESAKRWEENLKNAGKEQVKVAEALAKMRGVVREDEKAEADKKGKGPVEQVKDAENARAEAGDKAIELGRSLVKADNELAAKRKKLKDIHDKETVVGGRWLKEREAQKEVAMAQAARDNEKKALDDAETDMRTAKESERELKTQFAAEIAQAETDVKLEADRKLAVEQNKIFSEADKEREKQKEEDEKNISKKIKEQINEQHDLEMANLDRTIAAKSESIDSLQERIQKGGNAAGPSAALIRGTQAAESAINRAISGTRSVEDINKAQLKVEQDILKTLQKQKQTKTVTL